MVKQSSEPCDFPLYPNPNLNQQEDAENTIVHKLSRRCKDTDSRFEAAELFEC